MYGTIAAMRIKPNREADFTNLMREYETLNIPGFIGEILYQMDSDSNTYYAAIVFESREAYFANADDPAQHERYMAMRELLVEVPEWHDGEIVYWGLK